MMNETNIVLTEAVFIFACSAQTITWLWYYAGN